MAKKKFMEKVTKVNSKEFSDKKQHIQQEMYCRNIYVPKDEDIEHLLVKIFSRANRWLHQPIRVTKNGKKEIREYTFDRAHLVLIDIGKDYYIFLHDKTIVKNFRKFLVMNLLCMDNALESKVEQSMHFDELIQLSNCYKNFTESDEYSRFHFHYEKYYNA